MIIKLYELHDGDSKEVACEYDSKSLDIEFHDWQFTQPIKMVGRVEAGENSLSFTGKLESVVKQTCGRCLNSIENPLVKNFTFYYETKGLTEVDTTPEIRELLFIERPMVYRCPESESSSCIKNQPSYEAIEAEFHSKKKSPFLDLKNWSDRKKNKEN